MGAVIRGKVIRKDMAFWDGKNATASRVDATGGTVSGLQVNDYVDVLQVFGDGTNRTRGAIGAATSFIGSTTCNLLLSPGTWTIDDDLTIGANFTLHVKAGAVLNVSAGKTLTISGPVIRESLTWTSGSGTVTNSQGAAELIDLEDAGGNYAATNVEAAFAELASTSNGEGASIIGVEDAAGNYTGTDVEAILAELVTTFLALDISSLSTIEGNALAATDEIIVNDGGTLKRMAHQDAGLRFITESGTSRTLADTDMNTYIDCTNAGSVTITLNTGTGVKGNQVYFEQSGNTGTGGVSIAGTATVNAANGSSTAKQYSVMCLTCKGGDVWTLSGDTT